MNDDDTVDEDEEREDDDIDLLFDLCKDDFPLSPSHQTVGVGSFLHDLTKTGLKRDDPRLRNLMSELEKLLIQNNGVESIDLMKLNKSAFKR